MKNKFLSWRRATLARTNPFKRLSARHHSLPVPLALSAQPAVTAKKSLGRAKKQELKQKPKKIAPRKTPPPTITTSAHSQQEKFMTELQALRTQIDAIDTDIVKRIIMRLLLSFQVGKLKKQYQSTVYQLQREHTLIQKLLKYKKTTLKTAVKQFNAAANAPAMTSLASKTLEKFFPDQVLRNIYHELISASRAIQQPLRIAYLGAPGSFSYAASVELYGVSAQHIPYISFQHIFKALDNKKEELAIIPIENSTEGIVGTTVDLMVTHDVSIVMECFLPINLALLSRSKKLSAVRTLVSHVQPLSQAQQWTAEYLPDVTIKEAKSTAHAAELACKNPRYACITSVQLASYYPQLHILRHNIEDIHHNTTRFLALRNNRVANKNLVLTPEQPTLPRSGGVGAHSASKRATAQRPAWVTTLIFSTRHQAGSLLRVLQIFKAHNINMSNLVSRPAKKQAFSYLFFVDLDGHCQEAAIAQALTLVKKHTSFFKLLGSYPRGALHK